MRRVPLVCRRLLDPRPESEALVRPIADSVAIGPEELPQRTHELPPRDEVIRIARVGPAADRAVAWLSGSGRRAESTKDFEWTAPDTPHAPQIGRLWKPAEFLEEVASQIAIGEALDLACGSGRESVYLASLGFAVTGIDVLPDALARAADLAQRCAPAIEPIRWIERDIQRDPPDFRGRFHLITVFRYLHRPLLAQLGEWLAPGGHLVYETFTTEHRSRHGKPARDEHVLAPGELLALTSGLDIMHASEGWRGDAHTARLWANRP